MKVKNVILLLLLFIQSCTRNVKNEISDKSNFEIKQFHIDSLSQDIIEIFQNEKKLLTHTIYKEDGDCSSIQVELGGFEIKNDSIIFYTYWAAADRQETLVFPYGFWKQIYSLTYNGEVKLLRSEIYIEDIIEDEKHNGMKFLGHSPQDSIERKSLETYINIIETKYNSKFMLGKNKEVLIQEVKNKLSKEISAATKDWKELFGENINM